MTKNGTTENPIPMTTRELSIPSEIWEEFESLRDKVCSPSDSMVFTRLMQAFLEMDRATQMAVLYATDMPRLVFPDRITLDSDLLEGVWHPPHNGPY